ncbi:MAG: acyl--CoA ligase [Deltaproteobacteria bacterium]|nr:acyl--CoA ligase [Deltaproteobacteria bacterium]
MGVAERGARFEELSSWTVFRALEETAKRLPAKAALVEGEQRVTYADLLERARRMTAALAGAGIRKGDMVAAYIKNSVEMIVGFYAFQALGASVAWINPAYRENEAHFILENSGARVVFLYEAWQGFNYLNAVQSLRPSLPALEKIVVVPSDPGKKFDDPAVLSMDDLTSGRIPGSAPTWAPAPDDLSMLIYTSGTTGKPKGAMISQSQAVRAGWAYSIGVEAIEDDVFIAFLPMCHSYGCGSLMIQSVLLGSTLVLLDKFSAEAAFKLIEKEKVTLQLGAPAHYIMELENPNRTKYDLSSLRAGMIAGQIAPKGLIPRVNDEMGIYLISFLGSSEVGPGLSIILPYRSPLDVRETSIGYPLPGTRAKVVDPTTGGEKAPGEPGELLLQGWHVTSGYWRNPEETANQIRNGWLHTGDLVARDADGSFRILGRIKEFINRGGLKIIPSELERLLVEVPDVEEACVVGTPNPVLGESICACVRLREGAAPLSLADLRAAIKGKVADHKLPDELLILNDFPRMPGGLKVNRFGAGGLVEVAKTSSEKQVLARGK